MDKKISIVIPNYNGAKLLEKNLPQVISAARAYSPDTELIVVDDASTDNSVDLINANFPTVKLINKDKNEGFASTVNCGVKYASGDLVVLLNTDVVPEKNILKMIAQDFDSADVFAVGCMDLSMENGREVKRGRGIGKFERGFLVHSRGNTDKNNTLWATGGSSAFDRLKWLELGGMDEIYIPFYWEDIDLSYRALKKGLRIIFDQKAVVHHNHQEGIIQSKYSADFIKTTSYRNQFIFVWKNISDFKLITLHFMWLPYHLLKAFFRGDTCFYKGFFQAMILLLTKIPRKTKGVSDLIILRNLQS